jgi:hypothetical protein
MHEFKANSSLSVACIVADEHVVLCLAGFDNDQGAYQFVPKDHIAYRYEYISPLGDGSFGQCVKVRRENSACNHPTCMFAYPGMCS